MLDKATKTVWRIDLAKKTATPVLKAGQVVAGTKVADPMFLTTGGRDVLVLDSKNQLWRWRPTDAKGKGTLVKIKVTDSSSWGNDIKAIATFVANFDANFYKLYVVDPSAQNIMVLSPANDGSGYPVKPIGRLPTNRPVNGITDVLLDGDIYVAENGAVNRVIPATGWTAQLPKDTQIRPQVQLHDDHVAGPAQRGLEPAQGPALRVRHASTTGWSPSARRTASFAGQYRLAGNNPSWSDLQGMLVIPGADAQSPATLWWISSTRGQQRAARGRPRRPYRLSVRGPVRIRAPRPRPPQAATKKPTKSPKP